MILYKYSKAKWGVAILRELRLKVSPPNEFNDPFEFTPVTTNPLTPDMLVQLNGWLHKQGLESSSVESLQKILPVLMKTNLSVRDFAMGLIAADMESREESSKHFGVLCLSEVQADIRMWAHYGDNHLGVAVGLDFDNEVSGMDGVVSFDKVQYDKVRPQRNPMVTSGEEFHNEMVKTTMTKGAEWGDEREHRIIFRLQDIQMEQKEQDSQDAFNYFMHVRPETIREVVLGCLISDPDEQTARSLWKAKLPHAKLIKLKRHDTEFKLVPVTAP